MTMESYSGKAASSNGSVYVCNLPHGTDENMLAEYFGTIGLIKVGNLAGILWIFALYGCFFAFCHNLPCF